MIYAGILAGGTGTRMGISNLPKQFLELGDRPILIHTIEKFVLEPSIEKIVVGVHGDWVSHAEDLVDKYLSLHKDRIIITKGGADRNTSIEKIIEAIDAYRPITPEDIVITHDSVRPFITLRMIQDNIKLAQNHDAVDTVVEAVDTIVESTNGQFITDIGIYDNDEAPECRHLFFMLHGMILHNYSSSISIMALSSTSIMISASDVALLSFS